MRELLLGLHGYLVSPLLTLLFFVLLAYVVMSWLFTFGVVNMHNQTARQVFSFLESILEPLVRPIRRIVPPLGQLDISILILALLILFVRDFLILWFISLLPA